MAAASLLPITLDSDILGAMEAWAWQQPVDALPVELREVEKIFETLDIAGLYAILLRECSARTRKSPSYCGGIRISPEDIGAPAPYAALEHYRLADGSEQSTRDPGDALWAEIFDLLPGVAMAPGLPQRRQERRLDADPRQGGRLPSQELLRCLRAARLLIEDLARTAEERADHSCGIGADARQRRRAGAPQGVSTSRGRHLRQVAVSHMDRFLGRGVSP